MDDYLSTAGYVKIYGGLFIYEKDPAALLRPFASDKQSAPGRVRLQIKLVEEASGHIRAILRWSWVYAKPSGGEEQELFPVEGTEFLKDLQAIRQILDGKSASTYPIAH